MEKRSSARIYAIQDLQSRFGLSEEDAEELIQDHFYSDEHGRTVFEAVVLQATDYSNADGTDAKGSYLACYLRPLFYHDKLVPWPCSLKGGEAQACATSLHPVGKSESMVQNSKVFPLDAGDTVTCYFAEAGPNDNGKMRVLNFYLDRKASAAAGNYSFDCLDRRTSESIKTQPYQTGGKGLGIKPGGCLRYKTGMRWDRQASNIKIGGQPAYNGRFDRVPNSYNSYRGGYFRQVNYVTEMTSLAKMGVTTIVRLNGETKVGHIGKTVKDRTLKMGLTGSFVYKSGPAMEAGEWKRIAKLNGIVNPKHIYIPMRGRGPAPAKWNIIKDALAEGNTYLHCTHGVDRTGATIGRWIFETELAFAGINTPQFTKKRQKGTPLQHDLWNYTTSFGGAWKHKPKVDKKKKEDAARLAKGQKAKYPKTKLEMDPDYNKGKNTRPGLTDVSENDYEKEWFLGVDTGFHKNWKVSADHERAKKVKSRCP